MRDPMRSNMALFAVFSAVTFMILASTWFAQVKKQDPVVINGTIESVAKNFALMAVNELPILLSSTTTVLDEKGNSLMLSDLKPKRPVRVEAIQTKEGYQAVRIVIRSVKEP